MPPLPACAADGPDGEAADVREAFLVDGKGRLLRGRRHGGGLGHCLLGWVVLALRAVGLWLGGWVGEEKGGSVLKPSQPVRKLEHPRPKSKQGLGGAIVSFATLNSPRIRVVTVHV